MSREEAPRIEDLTAEGRSAGVYLTRYIFRRRDGPVLFDMQIPATHVPAVLPPIEL